ncbi:MAG: hypothetical protein AB1791_11920 [Chloroflexota bacterium]
MNQPTYFANVQKVVAALLHGQAQTTPALRQAVEAQAARLGGATRSASDIPADLAAYVDKVAQHAYKITDQDVEQLKAAGYSEDTIFEVTLSAALGAGLARLERGLAALRGGE